MNSFIIQSDSEISFTLKQGTTITNIGNILAWAQSYLLKQQNDNTNI